MHFDLNVYLGHWPFRRLQYSGAKGVRQLMSRTGVGQAVAIPLQAVFYKDCLDGVVEMIDDMGQDEMDLLPLGMVNPSFPGWERDLSVMVEDLGCVGCGIIPPYHGYQVYDPCAEALFRTLIEMDLPALLFVRLRDERLHHWHMPVPSLPVEDISYVLKTFPDMRTAVCNANLPAEGTALIPVLADRAPTLFTTAYKSLRLSEMVARMGAEHIAYGSGMPLTYPESSLLQVLEADIDARARTQILGQNARAFLKLEAECNAD